MTTSGKHEFNLPIDDLLLLAKNRVGGQWVSKIETTYALQSLNLLLAELINVGVPLSLFEEVLTTVQASVGSYSYGVSVMDIHSAILRRDSTDVAMMRKSHSEFLKIPKKSQTGRPIEYAVERDNNGVTTRIWPLPENSTDIIVAYAMKRPEDVASLRDTIDLPWRYLPCIVAGLAWYMSLSLDGSSPEEEQILEAKRQRLKAHWEQLRIETLGEDRERTSFFAVPQLNLH
jgi:hypothetical protein